jgi:hypothetical protein
MNSLILLGYVKHEINMLFIYYIFITDVYYNG